MPSLALEIAVGVQEAAPLSDVQVEPAPAGEFRQITMLFADLAGYTQAVRRAGGRRPRILLEQYNINQNFIRKNYTWLYVLARSNTSYCTDSFGSSMSIGNHHRHINALHGHQVNHLSVSVHYR